MNTTTRTRIARTFTLTDEAQEKLGRIAAAEMRSRSMVVERLILEHYRNYMKEALTPINKAVKPAEDKQ